MQHRHMVLAALTTFASLGISSRSAAQTPAVERVVVNRIVAVVGADAITLRELERRVEPFLAKLAGVPSDKRPAAESQVRRDMLQQIIDDRLIAREARAAKIIVATTEIDAAIDAVAAAKKLTRARVIEMVGEQGFSEAQYREEIVRQLLTTKLVRMYMADRVRNFDKDPDKAAKQMDAAVRSYLQALRARVYIEVRL